MLRYRKPYGASPEFKVAIAKVKLGSSEAVVEDSIFLPVDPGDKEWHDILKTYSVQTAVLGGQRVEERLSISVSVREGRDTVWKSGATSIVATYSPPKASVLKEYKKLYLVE